MASGALDRARGTRRSGRLGIVRAILILAYLPLCHIAFAGPPFLTDDPEPVEYRHWEFYTFSTLDRSRDGTQLQAPAFELNYGFAPNFQAHAVLPFMASFPRGGPSAFGAGDTELGVKYRFVQETELRPMVGAFPMLELPTGDSGRGTGNGKAWAKVPLWLQKSWGDEGAKWTTYGGGGYAFNPAAGQRDYPFGGWLLQRDVSDKLTLGAELFAQGKTTDQGQAALMANAGGCYNFSKNFSLLLTVGHAVAGERHLTAYVGFYWTW